MEEQGGMNDTLWSKEYLNISFNCMNDVTIPCNVSIIMIAWSKWVVVYIDVTNSWEYLNFINSENASVMVVAMKRLYASRLSKCLVDWNSCFRKIISSMAMRGKTLTNARIYHVKEPNFVGIVRMHNELLNLNCEFWI